IRMAADEGAKWIGWTTGENKADAYRLRKQVDALQVREHPPQGDEFLDDLGRAKVGNEPTYTITGSKDGEAVVTEHRLTRQELEQHVGKEVAARLIEEAQKDLTPEEKAEKAQLEGKQEDGRLNQFIEGHENFPAQLSPA